MILNHEYLLKGVSMVLNLQTFPVFCIYLLLIAFASTWQRSTSPLSLRYLLIIYNFMCSALSMYTSIGFSYELYQTGSLFQKSNSEILLPYFRLYWITKHIELLDTVFMILRHKKNQLSFLHVYHHSSILLLSDLAYNFYPWPAIAPILGLNSVVHIVLYLYYGLTALNPTSPPQWKKQLTQLQIVQFFIDFVYALYGYLYHGFCVYGLLYGIGMTALFMNFYHKAYRVNRGKKLHTS